MAQHWVRSTPATLTIIVALLFATWPPLDVRAQEEVAAPRTLVRQAANFTALLPVVVKSSSDFVITSPFDGGEVSGTTYFAVQPTIPGSLTSVSFKAGASDLGSDTTPADGFKVFLDARTLPAGPVTLTATATGAAGTSTQSIMVNAVPNPPASAVVGAQGAVLASEIGSVITVPPGAVPAGTTIAVDEKSQQEITNETGFNWDAQGVTFLGAQQVQSNTSIARSLGVSSAGFGQRVQPGQAVVNYRILPDADGDGVSELVVVNTASVAPTNDVISDPVPQAVVRSSQSVTRASSRAALTAVSGLSGPTGTLLKLKVNGFNPASVNSNVGVFRSSINGEMIEVPGIVTADPVDATAQIFTVVIPPLAPGGATLTLRNDSSATSAGPFDVTIAAPVPLSQPATAIIDQFLGATITYLQQVPTAAPEDAAAAAKSSAKLQETRTKFQQLVSAGLNPETQQALDRVALTIQNAAIFTVQPALASQSIRLAGYTTDSKVGDILGLLGGLAGILGAVAGAATATALLPAIAAGVAGAVAVLVVGYYACKLIRGGSCFDDPPTSPSDAACSLVQAASGGGTTGMGSAPPSGGSGCGNIFGGSSPGSLQRNQIASGIPARYTVRIFPRGGTGAALSPFTGAADAGGYFFIPIIPQDQPFTAVAVDQLTGAAQTFDGIGPPLGQSVLMSFDFTNIKGNRYQIKLGDTVSDGVPSVGAGNIEQAGGLDIYTFPVASGQQIFLDLQAVADSLTYVGWRLIAPDGSVVFDQIFNCCGGTDPGGFTLGQAGIYTLRVGASTDPGTGTYSFKLWSVPPASQFAIGIGDVVASGAPGVGAGSIETPGSKDIYRFNAAAGQQAFFDILAVDESLVQVNWKLLAPDGSQLFDTIFNCCGGVDPGVYTLAQGGTYTIIVGDDKEDAVGSYSFRVVNVPATQQFSIAIGDVVAPGAPGSGAGVIETPGSKDSYAFTANAGQVAVFDLQNVVDTLTFVRWQLVAPDGSTVFDDILNCCGGSDRGPLTLDQSGTYTLIVGSDKADGVGTYGFQIQQQ